MKLLRYVLAAVALAAVFSVQHAIGCNVLIANAIAQEAVVVAPDTTVEIPISTWLDAIAPTLLSIAVVVFAALTRHLPSQITAILTTKRVEQILGWAINYGINVTKNATKGQPLQVNVGSEVLENALQYVIDNAPAWLVSWMGGEKGVREKIVARLDIVADDAIDPNLPAQTK